MSNSLQHTLGRVRPPRVQITYDVEVGNAIEKKVLPFIIGIMADLRGHAKDTPIPLKERKFIYIDRDNLNVILKNLQPRLVFQVESFMPVSEHQAETAEADGKADKKGKKEEQSESVEGNQASATLSIEIVFTHMDDFHPNQLVKIIPVMAALYQSRIHLTDMVSKVESNDHIDRALLNLIENNDDVRNPLMAELDAEETPEIDKFLQENLIVPDADHLDEVRPSFKDFLKQLNGAEKPVLNTLGFIENAIASIDDILSKQMDAIVHHPDFQKLESSWRGLHYLVMNSETSTTLKLRVLSITRDEMQDDLEKAVEFDQSHLFKKIYEEEYGTFGGNPYSALLCDLHFSRHPKDLELLRHLSGIAAAAHAPMLAAASPALFGMDNFASLNTPRDLAKIFESSATVKWNSFRDTEDSRYVTLLLPRILMRQPYGAETDPISAFMYDEAVNGQSNEKFCWGNPAYTMAQRLTNAFALYGWTAAVRGVEGGGLVSNLPVFTFQTPQGDLAMKSPVEVIITDRREKELSDLGFLALCHCKGKDYAAFFGSQTTQKPKLYNLNDANANAATSARLPYLLNASRFAHYIKVMMRDKVGSFMGRAEIELYLQKWLSQYILLSDVATQDVKAKYPLREASIQIVESMPGEYKAVIFLRPHFQLEELTTSLRLVATLPSA